MLYTILKATIKIGIQLFFRKIQIQGLENIPLDRPVLLVSNHPNAFMDSLVVSVFVKKPFHYLARGDAFSSSFMNWFLTQLKLIPIYRLQEGADQLQKNEETFDKCYHLLDKKGIVMVFPEGICVQERRLRKLKKGMAKIAFGALEFTDYKLDLCIVPLGINYTTPSKSRGDVFITIAPPIEVSPYIEPYKKDKAKTIIKLTSDVEAEMAKLIVIIDSKSDEQLVEQIETIYKEKLFSELGNKKSNLELDFILSQKIAEGVTYLRNHHPEKHQTINKDINNYFSHLNKFKLNDAYVRDEIINRKTFPLLFPKIILLVFTFPLHVLGLLTNYIPYKLPYLLTKKIAKNIEFFSSVNIALGTFIFIFYYVLQSVAVTLYFNNYWLTLVFLFSAPFLGFFSLNYLLLFKEVIAMKKIKNNLPEAIIMQASRTKIIAELGSVRKQFQDMTAEPTIA